MSGGLNALAKAIQKYSEIEDWLLYCAFRKPLLAVKLQTGITQNPLLITTIHQRQLISTLI